MLPLIKSYEKYTYKQEFKQNICSHCKSHVICEFTYYKIEKALTSKADSDYNAFYLKIDYNVQQVEQIPLLTIDQTVIVLVSFFSLFFGGSVLAIFDIISNIIPNIYLIEILSNKVRYKLKAVSKILDLFSNLTTIHCIKYVSSKVANIKRFLWLLILISAFVSCIIYSVNEITNYIASNQINLKKEINKDFDITLPQIDYCQTKYLENNNIFMDYRLNEIGKRIKIFVDSYEKPCFLDNPTCLLHNYISNYYNNYKELLNSMKINDTNLWNNILSAKISNELIKKDPLKSIKVTNNLDADVNNDRYQIQDENVYLHHLGALYKNKGFQVSMCKRMNWSLFYKNSTQLIEINPFIKLRKNQIAFEFKKIDNLEIYFEKYGLFNFADYFGEEYGASYYLTINNYINNFDACKDDKKCISSKQTLLNYTQHHLFFCNHNFQQIFYRIFNCTPFYSNKISNESEKLKECSAVYLPIIQDIFKKFKNRVYNCKKAKDLLETHRSINVIADSFFNTYIDLIIDLNDVKVYQQKTINEYDLFKLISNISNFFNIAIGFSFLTLIEIIILVFTAFIHQKISTVNLSI